MCFLKYIFWNFFTNDCDGVLASTTSNGSLVPLYGEVPPKSDFQYPLCVNRYVPGSVVFGISHSTVALLAAKNMRCQRNLRDLFNVNSLKMIKKKDH